MAAGGMLASHLSLSPQGCEAAIPQCSPGTLCYYEHKLFVHEFHSMLSGTSLIIL